MSVIYKRGSAGRAVARIQRALHICPDGKYGPLTEEAVREFQAVNKIAVDGICGVRTLMLLGMVSLLPKSKRYINEIIVHCTATPAGKDYTVDDIRRWHLQRGFSDIGYHYVIYRDGTVHEGRSVDIAGAHCEGHNTHSIGVCYVGGVQRNGKTPSDTRTNAQRAAMLNLLFELREAYPNAKIHGHRDYAAKACPSFDATTEYKGL